MNEPFLLDTLRGTLGSSKTRREQDDHFISHMQADRISHKDNPMAVIAAVSDHPASVQADLREATEESGTE